MSKLVQKSIANLPRTTMSEWLTADLKEEIRLLRPVEGDIDADGNRNATRAAVNCGCFFHMQRYFCSQHQLEAALHEFSSS